MVDKNLFLTNLNYVEPSNRDVDAVSIYKYDDPMDVPFIPETNPKKGQLNVDFIKWIKFKGGIVKTYLRCKKYYDKKQVLATKKLIAKRKAKGVVIVKRPKLATKEEKEKLVFKRVDFDYKNQLS